MQATVVFIVGLGDTAAALRRLAGDVDEVVKRAARARRDRADRPARRVARATRWRCRRARRSSARPSRCAVDAAVGRISCESIASYPPGRPRAAAGRAHLGRDGRLPARAGGQRRAPARRERPGVPDHQRPAWRRLVIDPQERWAQYGEKPDYAGLLTFAGVPYTEDPAELAGFDVAVVGAPMDDLVSDRPGARLAPRAIRGGELPARPAPRGQGRRVRRAAGRRLRRRARDPRRRGALARRDRGDRRPGARGRRACRSCSAATTRSPSRRCAPARPRTARSGIVHFDTHTDTGEEVFGVEFSHGTFIRRLVDAGPRRPRPLRPDRPARLLAGRGGVRAGRPSAGSRACSCTTSATSASARWCARAIEAVGAGPDLPDRRRRRARPRLHPRHRHAGAGRHDRGRPAARRPHGRRRARPRRRRRRRGHPDERRHRRLLGAGRRARHPRGADGDRAAPRAA